MFKLSKNSISRKRKTQKSRHRISPEAVVKKYRSKQSGFWCSPRKVKNINSAGKINRAPVNTGKPKKVRRRKASKVAKNVRRIDILAQPRSMDDKSDQNLRSSRLPGPVRKGKITDMSSPTRELNFIRPRKPLATNKLKPKNDLGRNFARTSRMKDSSQIVLPRRMGMKLFSLVSRKLKELTNSKNM